MTTLAFLPGVPGWMEILLILLVVLIFFGPKRLPELSRSIGRSLSEFKKGKKEGSEEPEKAETESDSDPAPPREDP